MGSAVQEIFPGRGDKTGKGFGLKRSIPLVLLVSVWLGLLIDLPLSKPLVWFPFAAAAVVVCSVAHFHGRRKTFAVEFLFSLFLLLAGAIQFWHSEWLRDAYFPALVLLAAVYPASSVIPLSLLLPFLGLRSFLWSGRAAEEAVFALAVITTASASALIFERLKRGREKAVSSLDALRNSARDIAFETDMESLSSEELTSHYFASILKADEEIKELLAMLRHTVFADSATLFVPDGGGFMLRCSTEEGIIVSGKGVIAACMKDRKPFASGEVAEKGIDTGYLRGGKIGSVIAVPVAEGATVAGVVAVDSGRYEAFSEVERKTVQMLAGQLARVLERERIYLQVKREFFGLNVIKEASSKLVSSLNVDVIVKKLCGGAERILPSRIFFFLAEGRRFRLIFDSGGVIEGEGVFDLGGTFLNMVIENRQPLHISDVTDLRVPVMPFGADHIASVLAIPMFYESQLLGLFAATAPKKEFIEAYQISMLKVLCNQAATSIANARLHAEIERMATTDGLTGLFNHRRFQERIYEEFRRMNRSREPLSLLLADIDFFKKVNDTYGHPAGDLVLKGVAQTIRETIRDVDIPARYGGEEFAVVLPGTAGEGAKQIAERLRAKVMAKTFSADGKQLRVTMSIGIATSPNDAKTKEELIEKADQALYQAKKNGRNRSVLSGAAEKDN